MLDKSNAKKDFFLPEEQIYLPKFIGIVYSDVKREYFPTEAQYLTEKDAEKDAGIVAKYLEAMGIKSRIYPGNSELAEKLRKDKPDMVINLVDSVKGVESLASTIPAVLELLEMPYTGAGILGQSMNSNKFLTMKLLDQVGVPTPHYQLFNSPNDDVTNLRYPLISKLNEIHGAVEITKDSISENEKHLRQRLKFLIDTYKQPVLVEEFIAGQEVTAIIFEGGNKKVYIAQTNFRDDTSYQFKTFDMQWVEESYDSYNYAKYEITDDSVLKKYVRDAFDVVRMDDYGKFDVRIDASGRYHFIDVNTNPAFGPKELDTAIGSIMDLYGVDFTDILKRLIINTMKPIVRVELVK